jgi:hypothetical protein
MSKSFADMSASELIAETTFETYGAYIDAQTCFIMWERPDADERAMLVVPFTYCPNVSELLDDSNWETIQACLAEADPTGDDYQVCSFGHWATPYKLVTVRAGSKAHAEAERIVAALADYPVLDEEDFSEREHEAQLERLEDIIRDIERDVDPDGDGDEWSHDEMAGKVSSELPADLSELTSRATDQVREILVSLGYLE